MAKQLFSFQHDFLVVETGYVFIHALSIACPVNARYQNAQPVLKLSPLCHLGPRTFKVCHYHP